MSKLRVVAGTLVALVAVSAITAPVAVGNGRPLKAELAGANEVPGPGDPDGTGEARLRLNQGRKRICYVITVENVADPTFAHIHTGAAGVPGGILVDLDPTFVDGTATGCVQDVARADIKAIRRHPGQHYVNVHSIAYPDGAVRGQLERWAPGR